MNAIMERWVGSVRREFLNRTLIWNHEHLCQTLHGYELHHNTHRPHISLSAAAHSSRCRRTSPTSTPCESEEPAARAASSTSIEQPPDQHG